MKVIHVITRLILGGAQENTLFTVEGLNEKKDYEVALVSGPALGPEGSLIERAKRKGINLVVVNSLRREISPGLDILAFRRLFKYFKREKPTIVHTHSSKAGVLGRLAARLAKVPVILHTIHGMPFHRYQGRLPNSLFILAERFCAGFTDKIVTVAQAMTDQALEAEIAPPEKFVKILSGMEVEKFLAASGRDEVRRDFGIKDDEFVIGTIARLFHLKGHEYMMEAAPKVLERFPKVKFLFVGDGILREQLELLADDLGIRDHFVFAGLTDPENIPRMIQAMDLLVHTSLREGLARVLPQGLISGKPVISYDIDGAREVVKDGETGYLVPAETVTELADAIIKILENPAKAKEMGARGRALFADAFRKEAMVAQIDKLYRQICKEKGIEWQ